MSKPRETAIPTAQRETPADRAVQEAQDRSNATHLAYVGSLEPRERCNLAPWAA